MSAAAVDVAVDVRCRIGESPLWDVREDCLYWVDISGQAVWRHDTATDRTTHWSLPQPVGCIAPRASGGFIAALQTGVYAFTPDDRRDTLELTPLAAAVHPSPQRFNDGRCDRQGRFWVGSMFPDPAQAQHSGRLARLDAGVWAAPLLQNMIVPNGLAFSPDGRTLYASDSHASVATVWAFDYEPETGRASGQRVFIDRLPAGRPDGAAVDTDGCYWICANDGAAVLRYTPAGALDRRIELPVAKPSMCAFGGARLDTLFVTSIRPDGDGALAQPLAGAVFSCRPGAQGLAEPAYAG